MRRIDLLERQFGDWTVLAYAGFSDWLCRCSCGAVRAVAGNHLRDGRSQRCRNCYISQTGGPDALVNAFWARVNKDHERECWEWQGHIQKDGYGTLSAEFGKAPIRAHRLSYQIAHGDIPHGLMICHHCDNPSCVNPWHLYAGTAKNNSEDMVDRKRGRGGATRVRFGSETTSAKLTEDAVKTIIREMLSVRSNSAIAQTFGVSRRTVADIRLKRTWPKVWEQIVI